MDDETVQLGADETVQLGAYLRAHRDRLRPDQAGLPVTRGRRVLGLRRQEVAELAGISADYYLRLEQGKDRRPSVQVLSALARTFHLDPDGRDHLFRLAGQHGPRSSAPSADLEGLVAMVSAWSGVPAVVVDPHQDLVVVNALGRWFVPSGSDVGDNLLEALVDQVAHTTDPRLLREREIAVADATAALRFHGDPASPRLAALVRGLSARSAVVRRVWDSQEARPRRAGTVTVDVGTARTDGAAEGGAVTGSTATAVTFRSQTLEVHGGAAFLTTFYGTPGSPAAAALAAVDATARPGRRAEVSDPRVGATLGV
ncbi:helix-turn-helix domain-containing protein [Curtobacterium sp. MCBA15_012]|uniref:MmyB family transcriptional regulator n=1 Tax=Curtobacterium sp. MCBA15_012 TaxID=1898738 RepID=UPI000AA92A6E|nr:helix-turn-helix domain-containing protein [Curtobacterium sp. MCBA15_012]WIB00420.1 helix-turn-helix domain-containing protein [Curtobacterium sp. MCBA15_012]